MNRDVGVSIFCLTYNHVDYIQDTLEGFIKQKTNYRYNVFVYDDASTDGTSQILLEYQNKYPELFRVYISEYNRFKDRNMKKFIYDLKVKNLTAKYVAMCEGDDYWTDENKLQMQVDYMEAHPECSMYIHNCKWLDCITNTMTLGNPVDIEGEGDVSAEELIMEKNGHPPTASFLYRRELFKEDFFFFNAVVGDYPLLLCALNKGKVHYNSIDMSVYRYKSKGSWSGKMNSDTDENKLYQCGHYIGIIDFLHKYDQYTNYRYQRIIKKKIVLCTDALALCVQKSNLSEEELYNTYVQHTCCPISSGKKFIHMAYKLAEYRKAIFMEKSTLDFVKSKNNIIIMGTGAYSEVLTQQFLHCNIDFAGYAVTHLTDNNMRKNGKKVWQLDKLPYERKSLGVVAGILAADKEDIISSLETAGIKNYIMPYGCEWMFVGEDSNE